MDMRKFNKGGQTNSINNYGHEKIQPGGGGGVETRQTLQTKPFLTSMYTTIF